MFFVQKMVARLDLSRFEQAYSAEGGELYCPEMMFSLWLYAYGTGLTSARELERRISEELPLRYLAGGAKPDHWALRLFDVSIHARSMTSLPRCWSLCASKD